MENIKPLLESWRAKFLDYENFDFSDPIISQICWLNGCFITCNTVYRIFQTKFNAKPPLLVGFLACVFIGMGGSILVRFLLGKQQPFLEKDSDLGYMLAIWLLTILSPFELSYKITGNMFVEIFSMMLNGAAGAGGLISTIDLGVGLFPKNHVAPIMLGFINGCGGAILSPIVFNLINGHHLMNSFFANGLFSLPLISPLAASAFYYYAKHILQINEFYRYSVPQNLQQTPQNMMISVTPEFIVRCWMAAISVYFVLQRNLSRPVETKSKTSESSTNKKVSSSTSSSKSKTSSSLLKPTSK